jgi:hypothetical protein
MEAPALDEGLAVDPAQDVAALLVDPEPARRCVEAGALEAEENLPRELGVRAGRPTDGVADSDYSLGQGAAGEL